MYGEVLEIADREVKLPPAVSRRRRRWADDGWKVVLEQGYLARMSFP
jgi:hypothetical protein